MAKTSGLGQEFYLSSYDLSGDVASIGTMATPREALDVTAINASAHERVMGLADGNISFTTYFNDAAGQEHAALSGLPTTDVQISWLISGTRGDPAVSMVAKQIDYNGTRGTEGSLTFDVNCHSTGTAPDWGVLLTAGSDTHSSAGATASVDNGAATSNGLVAYLHLVSIASGTATVAIQGSSDNGSSDAFANVAAFTAASAGATERITASGAVERYLRINTTGTFSNAVIVVTVRRGTAQDDVSL